MLGHGIRMVAHRPVGSHTGVIVLLRRSVRVLMEGRGAGSHCGGRCGREAAGRHRTVAHMLVRVHAGRAVEIRWRGHVWGAGSLHDHAAVLGHVFRGC